MSERDQSAVGVVQVGAGGEGEETLAGLLAGGLHPIATGWLRTTQTCGAGTLRRQRVAASPEGVQDGVDGIGTTVRSAVVGFAAVASLTVTMPGAHAAQAFRAHWTLDEIKSATAADSSGNGNNGTNIDIVGDGSGYTFNGTSSRVVVPSSSTLNPGSATFSYGVTLSMTKPPPAVGDTYDVLRKGLVTTAGGDYKLEVKNVQGDAVAVCVVKSVRSNGTKVLASVQASRQTLADGRSHDVSCTKTSTTISVAVDTRPVRSKTITGGLGSVSNTAQLALGAKAESAATSGFDWYDGVLSDAWVQ